MRELLFRAEVHPSHEAPPPTELPYAGRMNRNHLMAGLLTLLSSAAYAADIYVPGTLVSYAKHKDPITDENQSNLYVDEVNDTVNKTYVNFQCEGGRFVFYLNSKDILLSQQQFDDDTPPDFVYRVDSQQPKTLKTVTASSDDKPDLNTLAVEDRSDLTILNAFKGAQSKVVIRVLRQGMRELTFTFPVKGFAQGLKAVNNCK